MPGPMRRRLASQVAWTFRDEETINPVQRRQAFACAIT